MGEAEDQILVEGGDGIAEPGASAEETRTLIYDRLAAAYTEIATLRRRGFLADSTHREACETADMLTQIFQMVMNRPLWWRLLPRNMRQRSLLRILQRRDVFDSLAYRARYPDVAASGIDPLLHYLYHGRSEGRQR